MTRFVFIALLLFGAKQMQAQKLSALTLDQLLERMEASDTIYVVNFWATWCVPCIKELPELEVVDRIYRDRPVRVLLVSLDFPEAYPDRISLFQKRRRLAPEVIWLEEDKPNEFIPRIHPGWQGSIPATWIYSPSRSLTWFKEGMIDAQELESVLEMGLAP